MGDFGDDRHENESGAASTDPERQGRVAQWGSPSQPPTMTGWSPPVEHGPDGDDRAAPVIPGAPPTAHDVPPTAADMASPLSADVQTPAVDAATAPTRRGRRRPQWLAVAIVSALIGGAAGAAIAEGLGTGSSNQSIMVGSAAPGPALAGGASIPSIVKSVLPEVVSIDAKGPSGGGFTGGGTSEDQGTGMIINGAGEVITNDHVVAGAATITVTLYNQTSPHAAKLVGADSSNDLALLKIVSPPSNLQPVTFGDSTHLQVGDAAIAIGNALGLSAGTPTVTSGIVSALGRTVQAGDATGSTENLSNLIQTDAAINSGNSGGPLVDSAGEVVGIDTAVASSTSGNAPAQNIGFAIPSLTVQKLIPELRNGGTSGASKAYLGVFVTDETPQLQQQFGLAPSSGALVETVVPGSPAATGGIESGDVIVSFEGKTIGSAQDLTNAVQKASPGQSASITLWRAQQKLTVSATLGSQPGG